MDDDDANAPYVHVPHVGISFRHDHDPPQNPLPHEPGASHNQKRDLIEKAHAARPSYAKHYTRIGRDFKKKGLL